MRIYHLFAAIAVSALLCSPVSAQENDTDDELGFVTEEEEEPQSGLKSFGGGHDSWRRKEEPVVQASKKLEMISRVSDYITQSAISNLMNPEQVFCYKVASKPSGYMGYTIDGMALVSFCGILPPAERETLIEQFFTKDANISGEIDNCIIKPQMMFRFVRGVDYTDVLLSSPCQSYTVFYAGNIHTYNLAPVAPMVDEIINIYSAKARDFASPALLNQLLPIGIAQTDEQKKQVEEANGPIRKWQAEQKQEEKKNTGWNKLKFGN